MLPALELATIAAAVGVAVVAVVLALSRRPRARWYGSALRLLEATLVVQVLIATLALVSGHRPEELITFAAYALTSLIVIPALLALLASPDEEYGGPVWPHVLVAVAGAAVAVIVWRMGMTWPAAGA